MACNTAERQPHDTTVPSGTSLQAHRDANDGAWPETVAVNLWGLDSIKTKGEAGGRPGWLAGVPLAAAQLCAGQERALA